jgi:hypothetical protein
MKEILPGEARSSERNALLNVIGSSSAAMAVVERTGEMPYTETADMDYTMAENSWFTDVRCSDVIHS